MPGLARRRFHRPMALRAIATILSAIFILSHAPARADELRPAYIELQQKTETMWSAKWKASARSRLGKSGALILLDICKAGGEAERQPQSDNIITRLDMRCTGPLRGRSIGLSGLESSNTDALVRIYFIDAPVMTLRLTPSRAVAPIPAAASPISNVAATYTLLGVEHILEGFDHLLFVLALVLLIKGGSIIVKTVTAFTLAHSITLVGTTLGYLSLPQQPVEAVIALSIIFLGVEIVKSRPNHPRLSQRFPWIVAFLFGLLHGFGFAGALAEIGLPQNDVPLALLMFNIGVEIGQLIIVGAALVLLMLLQKYRAALTIPVKTGTAYAIGSMATYWFIERMIA